MRTCTVVGCSSPHIAKGYCQSHYAKWKRHGDPTSCGNPNINSIEDFWNKVNVTDGCWVWKTATDYDGYGMFWWKNRQVRAHRFVASFILGWDIDGLEVCHKCDNASCVNPEHLFVGTTLDNKLDSMSKGRHVRGVRCHTAKLTEDDVRKIRVLASQKVRRLDIARLFGVTVSSVTFVLTRRTWKHVK